MEARTFTETYVEAPDEETTPLQPDGTSTNGDGQQHATSNVLPDFSRQDNRPTFFFMTPSNDVYLDVHLQYAFDHHHLPQAPINIRVIHDDRELLVNTLAALEPHIYIFRPKTEVKRLDRLNSMKVSSFKGKLTGKVGGLIIGTPLGMIAGAAVGAILGGSVVRNRAVSTFGSIGGSYCMLCRNVDVTIQLVLVQELGTVKLLYLR